ncbi:MAG TPA: cytochrome P450 [Ktedonobacter sp.]|nr:cytochrome P450 [Ktedonobacter sp.]
MQDTEDIKNTQDTQGSQDIQQKQDRQNTPSASVEQISPTYNFPPGPKGLPFLHNTLQFQFDPLDFFRSTQRRFPRMATIHVGKDPIVLLFRPEHIRYVLTENPRNFVKINNRGGFNLKAFLGDGLLTTDGDFHRQQRRLVQPAFHRHRVESYADTMVQMTQEMLETWQPSMELNISQAMQFLTLRIIGKSLFNIDSVEQVTQLGQAFNNVIGGTRRHGINLPFLNNRNSKRLKMVEEGRQTLDNFIYNLIAQRRAEGRDTGDVLSMLLKAQDEGNTMTDKQVHDQVLTLIAAGHETAQNTLSWTFYLLSKHPEVREKLRAELHSVLTGRAPTVADLPNLPYLEWVINESWRILPPAWTQGRRSVNAFELDGYTFPADTIVVMSQWVLHNLPDIWGDPQNFRPERWNPELNAKVPQGAYFPFGMGPRICIGMPLAQMETKLLLATILQQYEPQLVPNFPVVLQPRVTLRPKFGMKMKLVETPKIS